MIGDLVVETIPSRQNCQRTSSADPCYSWQVTLSQACPYFQAILYLGTVTGVFGRNKSSIWNRNPHPYYTNVMISQRGFASASTNFLLVVERNGIIDFAQLKGKTEKKLFYIANNGSISYFLYLRLDLIKFVSQ